MIQGHVHVHVHVHVVIRISQHIGPFSELRMGLSTVLMPKNECTCTCTIWSTCTSNGHNIAYPTLQGVM